METKICFKCKETKDISSFHVRKARKNRNSYCKNCLYEIQKARWIDRKRKALELFGGQCSKCGYKKNSAALEFHHTDQNTKDFDWGKLRLMGWKKIIAELKKCILLCSNCHREEHNPQGENMLDSGTSNSSLNKIIKSTGICPTCNENVFGTKFCSVQCAGLANRKVERPGKEELIELIKTTPMTQIGKKFGVADNTIRKWAKFYGIIK